MAGESDGGKEGLLMYQGGRCLPSEIEVVSSKVSDESIGVCSADTSHGPYHAISLDHTGWDQPEKSIAHTNHTEEVKHLPGGEREDVSRL